MSKVVRVNEDSCDEDGRLASTPQQSVYVNNELVAVPGALTTPHDPDGIVGEVTSGSETVFAENQGISTTDHDIDCDHSLEEGSENVFVEKL